VEVLQLSSGRADKHVAHEESVVGTRADNADLDPVALIPAGETIDDVDAVTGVEVVNGTLTVDEPDLDMRWKVSKRFDYLRPMIVHEGQCSG
jgi:hypothetical protein